MLPFPVLVLSIVSVLEPVNKVPLVMLMVLTDMFEPSMTSVSAVVLLIVRILNVVFPMILEVTVPVNWIVLLPAVKDPLLIQSLMMECANAPGLKVVDVPMVIELFIVMAPNAVFVFPPDNVRLL